MNLKQIKAALEAAQGRVDDAMAAGNEEAARTASGEVEAYTAMYMAESARVQEERDALAAQVDSQVEVVEANIIEYKDLASQILGDVKDFAGVYAGFTAKGSIRNEDTQTSATGATVLPIPKTLDTTLQGVIEKPMSFFDTLPKFATNGAEQYFLIPTFTNNAAKHTLGDVKAKSAISWENTTSNLETIAHHIPVHKQMARRYDTLTIIINNALLYGLAMVKDNKCLYGNDSNGIVGVTNFSGINTWTMVTTNKTNIVDNIADMAAKATLEGGIAPNYCCLSPNAIRAIAKIKDDNGNYLFPNFKAGDVIPGTNMVSVEDVNMSVTTTTKVDNKDVTTTKEGVLVYNNQTMAWKYADNDSVEVGFVDDQFTRNAFTMLGECTGLFRLDNPFSVCYCADLGI